MDSLSLFCTKCSNVQEIFFYFCSFFSTFCSLRNILFTYKIHLSTEYQISPVQFWWNTYYYMTKTPWLVLYSKLPYKIVPELLDIQYIKWTRPLGHFTVKGILGCLNHIGSRSSFLPGSDHLQLHCFNLIILSNSLIKLQGYILCISIISPAVHESFIPHWCGCRHTSSWVLAASHSPSFEIHFFPRRIS